ncbi:hypothetical protein MHZ92_20060 [Sporosarcina sp. ACRSL]|uniref:hypothetical protein n=1 Tax=Sporosarcina sp. ACRSL TaxID=2918215 RepID=UPI001EF711CB|nr:hypothetical protein [Sporosarcina sp. ACRSL]MCG7346404.1 hypothetical protein [Sporosarcina sp. ACRSL]
MRITPSVSFNLDNDYERGLHEFAMEQDKYFSKYVKRLIEKDRSGTMTIAAPAPAPAAVMPIPMPPVEKPMKFTKAALKAFT